MKEQSLVGALSEWADEARESTNDLSRHFGQKVCRSKRSHSSTRWREVSSLKKGET